LRRVADADEIAGRIEQVTGIPMDVLSHEEEGLLTLLGVTLGDPVGHELLVADVGGGSSELVFAGPGREPTAIGLRLGSARLIERHADHDPPTWAEIAAMRAAADEALARIPHQVPDEMVVVGGGATNLLRIVPSAAEDRCLDKRRIHRAVGRLLGEPSAAAAVRHGIHPVRAHTLPAAAAILMSLLERFEVTSLRVSDASLREGALIAVTRAGSAWRAELASLARGPASSNHDHLEALATTTPV
jgi:exopolyphosphatase/guanosine-5'-triphosphate,3'-diphosphate pyrophosphatase